MPQGQVHSPVTYIVPIVLVVLLLGWRMYRMTQSRRLRLEMLWVTPAIFLALTVVSLAPQPPEGIAWLYLAAALVIGGALGWWRGKLMRITVDPQTHVLNTRASPAGMLFFVAIIAIRYALRGFAVGQSASLHLSVNVITGVFMALAVGLFGVQRLEMYLRGSRLLAEARAGSAAAVP